MYKLIDKSNNNTISNEDYRIEKAKLYYRILNSAKTHKEAEDFMDDTAVVSLTYEVLP